MSEKANRYTKAVGLAVSLAVVVALGLVLGPSGFCVNDWTIIKLRLGSVLLAAVAGAGLSVAGAVLQGVLRNPLADPYVLGMSGGAGLGYGLVVISGAVALGSWVLPAGAFAGALGCMVLVYMLAKTGQNIPVSTLLLAGVIVGAMTGALLMFIISVGSYEQMHDMVWWMLGNLQVTDWKLPLLVGAATAIGIVLAWVFSRELNVMVLGEEEASFLGVRVELAKKLFFVVASLMTGAVVSVCGLIGFVGLIIPHAVRLAIGPDNRTLIPVAAIVGAGFLILANTFAQVIIAPKVLPIGVVTAFLGGPFFIYLLRRRRKGVWI
ncbi:MAG: iron chelate uptake ABC transporter family permease subunit [Actinobacteria bacterium]|nr:iron chelate uptake ABC transporter family permease subunit [Actinomycetota bacterium]